MAGARVPLQTHCGGTRTISQAQVTSFFDRKARSFDAIYSGKKGIVGRYWDLVTRRNIRQRMQFTLEHGAPWEGQRVIDLGCGSGRYAPFILAQGAREVVSLDVSSQMIEMARLLAKEAGVDHQCRFVHADLFTFEDNEPFDVAIANGLFDYLADPQGALERIQRLVKGKIVANFPARCAFRVPFRWAWLRLRRCPVWFYGPRQIHSLLVNADFEVIILARMGPIYMAVATPVETAGRNGCSPAPG